MSFDDIVNKRLGFGLYQKIALSILLFVDLNDGAELVLMSFIMPIIQKEWHISSFQIALLTSMFYVGTAVGSCFSGTIADKYGRKISIQISSISIFIISLSFTFIQTVFQMSIIRFLYGITYGFSIPLTTSMLSEITPQNYRGKLLVFLNFFVSVGKLFGCVLAYIFLDNFSTGNWRLMMFFSAFPSLFVFLFSLKYLLESPRFLIASLQYERGFETINFIIKINNVESKELSQEEKDTLILWSKNIYKEGQQASVKALLSEDLIGVTIRMWIIWFMENSMYYGQLTIMPFVLGKSNKSFGNYFLTILGEAPSILLTLCVIDQKKLGRKNSLSLGFFFAMIFHFWCYYAQNSQFFSLITSIARFFMKLSFAMLYPFTTELYPTLIRTMGFGMCGGVGRLGSSFIPYLIFYLIEFNLYYPFFCFGIISLLALICSYTMPYCTLGKNLDFTQLENKQINIENKQIEMKLLK